MIYLERTKGISSTQLRNSEHSTIHLGLAGLGVPSNRFCEEINYVSGIDIVGAYSDNEECRKKFEAKWDNFVFDSFEKLLENVDAVYIAESRNLNFSHIKAAVEKGKHILCESPIFLSEEEACEISVLAKENRVVVMEALKTKYLPAFERLVLLINSGIIGTVKDIDVNCSQYLETLDFGDKYQGSIYDFGSYVLLPIVKLLGFEWKKSEFFTYNKDDFSIFVKGNIQYDKATASFRAGKGIKTEGDLVITGTKGYVYVPAPWWKMDYFEMRGEDLRKTRKFFYQCQGEGLRYEINQFVHQINMGNFGVDDEIVKTTQLIEKILKSSKEI